MTPVSAIIALLAAAPAIAGSASWQRPAPGLEFRLLDGTTGCRKGSPKVAVVRIDPVLWRLDLHHVSEVPEDTAGLDAEGWRKRTGAVLAINAGQYYPDRRPMGWFVKEGRNLGTKPIRAWKGILAAEPRPGTGDAAPRATLLDLEHDRFEAESTPYRVVLQSFMILDREAKKRVRRSDWHANRTIVATDRKDRLVVLVTEGAWTLWELADWLALRSGLEIAQAMSLDGGFESQVSIRVGALEYATFGQWHVDDRGDHSMPGIRVKLPGVVTLYPRK